MSVNELLKRGSDTRVPRHLAVRIGRYLLGRPASSLAPRLVAMLQQHLWVQNGERVSRAADQVTAAWLEVCAASGEDSGECVLAGEAVMLQPRCRIPAGVYRTKAREFQRRAPTGGWKRMPYMGANFPAIKGTQAVLLNESPDLALAFPADAAALTLRPEDAATLTRSLGEACAIIQSTAPGLMRKIRNDVWVFVPIAFEDRRVHHSFSAPYLPGAIFLSANADPYNLAEAIIHEHGHSELNEITAFSQLSEDVGAQEYLTYSPWRDDPRPLSGLMHALYVFSEVATFLQALLRTAPLPTAVWGRIQQRLFITNQRITTGLRQVRWDFITPFGRELVRTVASIHEQRLSAMDIAPRTEWRQILDNHLANWRRMHPAHPVRLPGTDDETANVRTAAR